MVIESVLIKNFRSIDELSLDFDELTVLLGANSAGKSTVIKALEWFFGEAEISNEDVRDKQADLELSVRVTFSNFTTSDREAFPGYTVGARMPLLKTRAGDGTVKLTGRGLVYRPFDEIRQASGRELTTAYRTLREQEPELNLPEARRQEDARSAMAAWEQDNPDKCEEDTTDATHLLGVVGGGVLRQRFKFVLVPAQRDASEDGREVKGSALSRLLLAIAEQRSAATERMTVFEEQVRLEYEQLVVAAHGATLDDLSTALTGQMRTLVSTGTVRLEARPGKLAFPGPQISVQAGESESLTELARQGHGFQRAFVISALQYLSETDVGDDGPTIFLALEEPELYQHPVRARHFATVLDRLAQREGSRVQVLYATHSPWFVNARKFESIRLLRRPTTRSGKMLPPVLSHATVADVEARLLGLVDEGHINRRLARTIDQNPGFSEAFFADTVLLVEGPTDAAVLRGVAAEEGLSLEAEGIVVCTASKTALPIAYAILDLLAIPTYIVFDGDRGCKEDQKETHTRVNVALQSAASVAAPADFPATQVTATFTIFEQSLEHHLRSEIADFDRKCDVEAKRSDWRTKSAETYAVVVRDHHPVPSLVNIVESARALAHLVRERQLDAQVEQLGLDLEG